MMTSIFIRQALTDAASCSAVARCLPRRRHCGIVAVAQLGGRCRPVLNDMALLSQRTNIPSEKASSDGRQTLSLVNSGLNHRIVQRCETATTTQRRWFAKTNKGAKMGQHRDRLQELAHTQAHNEAQNKRLEKKKKKSTGSSSSSAVQEPSQGITAHDDELDSGDHDDDDNMIEIDADGIPEDEREDGEALPTIAHLQERMHKSLERFQLSVKQFRGSEPTPELFDNILVDAYGDPNTPLHSVAQVVIQSPTQATASCYDPSLCKNVAAAIGYKLNLNPQVVDDGSGQAIIKISLPRLSLETRQQMVHQLHQRTESYRVRLRQLRRKAMDRCKPAFKGDVPGVSQDEAFRRQEEIEKTTETMLKKLNDAMAAKEKSIMNV